MYSIYRNKKGVFFENPDKLVFSKIIDFYLKNSFIFSLDNNIKRWNEIDIVYHLKYKELLNIAKKISELFFDK